MAEKNLALEAFAVRFDALTREQQTKLLAILSHQLSITANDHYRPNRNTMVIGRDTKLIGVNDVLMRVTSQAMAMTANRDDPQIPFKRLMVHSAEKYGCTRELGEACKTALETFDEHNPEAAGQVMEENA